VQHWIVVFGQVEDNLLDLFKRAVHIADFMDSIPQWLEYLSLGSV